MLRLKSYICLLVLWSSSSFAVPQNYSLISEALTLNEQVGNIDVIAKHLDDYYMPIKVSENKIIIAQISKCPEKLQTIKKDWNESKKISQKDFKRLPVIPIVKLIYDNNQIQCLYGFRINNTESITTSNTIIESYNKFILSSRVSTLLEHRLKDTVDSKFNYLAHYHFPSFAQYMIGSCYNVTLYTTLTTEFSDSNKIEKHNNELINTEFSADFLSTFEPVFFGTDGTAKDVVRLLPTETKDNALKLTWRLKADKLLYKPESYWVRFEAENGTISRDDAHTATITFNDIKVPVVLNMYVISANGKKTYKQIVSISPDGKITQISPKD